MSLENITGNLRDAYKLIVPGTMLHVDQLMNERRTNKELRDLSFYTADGIVYFLDEQKIPTLAITREAQNPVLRNIDDVTEQLPVAGNYRVQLNDFAQVLASPETTLITLPSLRLSGIGTERRYLTVGTTPAKYGKLNGEERKFAERVYGQGNDFIQNMKMLKDARISETNIFVLNPNYVREHTSEGAIARASWLVSFNDSSNFYAYVRYIDVHLRVRGVRREVVAEAFRKERHERSDLSGAKKNQGPY